MGNYSEPVHDHDPKQGNPYSDPTKNPYIPFNPEEILIQVRYGIILRMDPMRRAGKVVGALRVETTLPWVSYKGVTCVQIDADDRITMENPSVALKKAKNLAEEIDLRHAAVGFQTLLIEGEPVDAGNITDEEFFAIFAASV